jgi:hypothetical protein
MAMGWFRRRGDREGHQVWYVATVRRDHGKLVDVPFRTSATWRLRVRWKARVAVQREGYRDVKVMGVRRKDA